MRKHFIFSLIFILLLAVSAFAQSRTNRLYRPCSGSATPATVEIQRDGDIDLIPCSGRNILFNGVTITNGFTVSGASNAGTIPYFSTGTNLTGSGIQYDGATYTFAGPTLAEPFRMLLTPHATTGIFQVGDLDNLDSYFSLDDSTGAATLQTSGNLSLRPNTTGGLTFTGSNGRIRLGNQLSTGPYLEFLPDLGSASFAHGTGAITLTVGNSANAISIHRDTDTLKSSLSTWDLNNGGIGPTTFNFVRTVTTAGTTGNVTINQAAGTVNFAAGSGSAGLTVTNSTVTANSLVFAVTRTNDATCSVKNVVPAAGSFVIRMTANCTAETSVGFFVTN